MNTIQSRDLERRKVGYSSLLAKLAAARILLASAEKLATDAQESFDLYAIKADPDPQSTSAKHYCQSEAIYAAVEEAARSLELAMMLCPKLSAIKPVPPIDRYTKVIDGGPPAAKP